MHAKHLSRKSDDSWSEGESGLVSSTSVFLGHTRSERQEGDQERKVKELCVFPTFVFLI